jgi:G:T-mismatch repair DNA endonuclease (very short patch repair protein)
MKTASSKSFAKRKANAKAQLAVYKDANGYQKENKIERRVRECLDEIGVFYEAEHPIRHRFTPKGKEYYKVYDFYVDLGSDVRILIECHGDYYHFYDLYFEGVPSSKGTFIQKKNVRNDKIKHRIAKQKGLPLLVIWEKDIKKGKLEVSRILKDFFNNFTTSEYIQ